MTKLTPAEMRYISVAQTIEEREQRKGQVRMARSLELPEPIIEGAEDGQED